MAQYLIKKETLKELADTVRKLVGIDESDYESYPIDINQMIALTEASKTDGAIEVVAAGSTEITKEVFLNSDDVVEFVFIPNTVTSVGEDAFTFFRRLTRVIFGADSKLTSIARDAFSNCMNMTSIEIPPSVTSIGVQAFIACSSLKTITIPDGVKRIESGTFSSCYRMESIVLPRGLTYIGIDAFQQCSALKDVYFAGSEAEWNAIDIDETNQFNELLTNATIHYNYSPDAQQTEKPEINPDLPYYVIEEETLHEIADSVKNLAGIDESNHESYPIDINTMRVAIEVSKTDGAIEVISKEITSIPSRGAGAADNTTVKCVLIPNTVNSIIGGAFMGYRELSAILIPKSVKTIGVQAFHECPKIESIIVENGNTVYHSDGNCLIETESRELNLGCQNSVIPTDGSVTIIGRGAFSGCENLKSIIIPDGVTRICDSAFQMCIKMDNITIPKSVTIIEDYAFNNCQIIRDVYYAGTEEEWNAINIESRDNHNVHLENATIHYNAT